MDGGAAPAEWLRQLSGLAAVGLWLAVLAGLAVVIRRRWTAHGEWSRKLVHIGGGAVVPLAWWFAIHRGLAVTAAAGITLLALLNHRRRLLPAIEDVGRASYGTVAYGASVTLLLWLFWPQRADAVSAGVLVMACGDGLAGLLGPRIPSPSWRVLGERRSLAGTATMALVSLLVLLVLAAIVPVGPSLLTLILLALMATVLEQIAVLGLDNLTVPVAVALAWSLVCPGP
jgi:phytol kinase